MIEALIREAALGLFVAAASGLCLLIGGLGLFFLTPLGIVIRIEIRDAIRRRLTLIKSKRGERNAG